MNYPLIPTNIPVVEKETIENPILGHLVYDLKSKLCIWNGVEWEEVKTKDLPSDFCYENRSNEEVPKGRLEFYRRIGKTIVFDGEKWEELIFPTKE